MASDILNNILNALQQRPEDILKAAGAPHPLAEGVQNLAELFIPQTSKDVLTTRTEDIPLLLAGAIPGGPVAQKGVRAGVKGAKDLAEKLTGSGLAQRKKVVKTLRSMGLSAFREDRIPHETQLITPNLKDLELLDDAMTGAFKGTADDVGKALARIQRRLDDGVGLIAKQRKAEAGIGPVDLGDLQALGLNEHGRINIKMPAGVRKNLGPVADDAEKIFIKKRDDFRTHQNKARAFRAKQTRDRQAGIHVPLREKKR